MYFLYKHGVYGHGVFWIGDDLEEGKSEADRAATLDVDSYHEWYLCELGKESNLNFSFEPDYREEAVYTGVRSYKKP